MAATRSPGTPDWVKIMVGLGIVATAIVAVVLGAKPAVIAALATFVGLGVYAEFFGLLGGDDESGDGS